MKPEAKSASRHHGAVLATILISYLMIIFDVSIVITKLPKIQTELGFTPAGLSWVQSICTLTFGGFLLLAARWRRWRKYVHFRPRLRYGTDDELPFPFGRACRCPGAHSTDASSARSAQGRGEPMMGRHSRIITAGYILCSFCFAMMNAGTTHAARLQVGGTNAAKAGSQANMHEKQTLATIQMRTGNVTVTGELWDNPTTRDLLKLLPLNLHVMRWGDREYYGKPGQPISTETPKQDHFAAGDIMYWAPGGSFAIFLEDSTGNELSNLIPLGKVNSDLGVFSDLGKALTMTIEAQPK